MIFKNKYLLIIALLAIGVSGCKKWDDHTAIGNADLEMNLSQAVAGNSSLNKFKEYVTKAGLDSVLTSSKNYTVWAPTDAALQSLDPAIVNNVALLRTFIQNHISGQLFFTRDAQTPVRVAMLNGKYNSFQGAAFNDANITTADRFVKNGVLHVIDKAIPVLPSVWEFITSTKTQYLQNNFITSLDYETQDPELAIVDSISAVTGLPIYRPGTGIVVRNHFDQEIYDTKDESKQYTYFVIQDAGFVWESDSLKPFYATALPAVTDTLAQWNTVKDLMVEGLYPAGSLNGLVSKSGVAIPLDPAFLVETRKLSNGLVHIFSTIDVRNIDKYKEIVIHGESPSGFLSDRRGNTNYRVRVNPVTGQNYTDMMITGHGVTTYYAYYRINALPSMKYQVFALGVNDFQAGAFTQNIIPKHYLGPNNYVTLATLPHAVPLFTATGAYNEMSLGEFTMPAYGTLDIQLTCTGTNPIVMDYMRIVPVP